MPDEPSDWRERLGHVVHGPSEVPHCRRLRLVAFLLVVVGILGLVTAVMVAIDPTGEGLGDLLGKADADVMGQVRDAEGFLIPGAVVTDEATGASSTTGVSGWYFLEELDTGMVELRMEADGYRTVVKTVHLERGRYVVDFLAVPGSGEVEVEGTAVPKAGDPGKGVVVLTIGIVVFSALALAGAYCAYAHRWYRLVVIGALLGMLTWGWFIGSLLSLMALVLVLPLGREFGERAKESEMPGGEPPTSDLDASGEGDATAPGAEVFEVAPIEGTGDRWEETGGMPPGR